jgi:hypothetical protein
MAAFPTHAVGEADGLDPPLARASEFTPVPSRTHATDLLVLDVFPAHEGACLGELQLAIHTRAATPHATFSETFARLEGRLRVTLVCTHSTPQHVALVTAALLALPEVSRVAFRGYINSAAWGARHLAKPLPPFFT